MTISERIRSRIGITIATLGLLAAIPLHTAAATGNVQMLDGERKPLGAGSAYSWVKLNADGQPQSIGITFTDDALAKLPQKDTELALALPSADGLAFKTAVIDWNPQGHPPPHVYDVPHFDFHFYVIDEATRMAIGSKGDPAPKPDTTLVPAGFITDGETVPAMGMHYVPQSAPEFHGKPFTQVPIYGYANGKLAFVEAMVTRAYLLDEQSVDAVLDQPAKYEASGYYPTRYAVSHDATRHEYTVELSGFTKQ